MQEGPAVVRLAVHLVENQNTEFKAVLCVLDCIILRGARISYYWLLVFNNLCLGLELTPQRWNCMLVELHIRLTNQTLMRLNDKRHLGILPR